MNIKYVRKIKNNHGVITHYIIRDDKNNIKKVEAHALKSAIGRNLVNCLNLMLTSDNRLVDTKPKEVPYIERLTKKLRILGHHAEIYDDLLYCDDGIYQVKNGEVLLLKCRIEFGEFTIPQFVTGVALRKGVGGDILSPFSDCRDIKVYNKSQIKDMSYLFAGSKQLYTLDLSEFTTTGVTNMQGMFSDDVILHKIDIRRFDTSCVTDMSKMFYNCTYLHEIDLNKLDTSNVIDMSKMFVNDYQLEVIKMNKINTSKVRNMHKLFQDCRSLAKIDIADWDTSNVEDMSMLFYSCNKLTNLDISRWDMRKVSNIKYMIGNCYNSDTFKMPKMSR